MDGKKMVAAEEKHLIPLDKVNGYEVRPGFMESTGQRRSGRAVNFTVSSLEAAGVELLLYHRGEKEPYAVLPFPNTTGSEAFYSMIVFGLGYLRF